MLGHLWAGNDAGGARHERGQNLIRVISDGGYNPKTCDDDATHERTPVLVLVLCRMGEGGGASR